MLSLLSCVAVAHQPRFGAWVLLDDDGTSFARFRDHVNCFDSVSPAFYSCAKDGGIVHSPGVSEDTLKAFTDYARQHLVPVFGLLGDGGGDGVRLALSDPTVEAAQTDAIVKAVTTDGLAGVDLDYESMKPEDKDNFSSFVELLSKKLHRAHKLLAIAMCAKDTEPGDWSGSQSEDYARIGKAVDRARIMTYDQHETSGPAGPVADLSWVKRVMDHALSMIPRQKLEIGIPAYGYNWSKPKATSLTWTDFSALPGAEKAGRDPASNELLLPTDSGAAWFCDSASETAKLELASSLRVHGVYMWVMGSEDPKWWDVVKPIR